MKLYLSGPMSGLPGLNAKAFHDAAAALRHVGFEVVNPAETELSEDTDRSENQIWVDYMLDGLLKLSDCEGVAVLNGWMSSPGASIEAMFASRLGLEVAPVDAWLETQMLATALVQLSEVVAARQGKQGHSLTTLVFDEAVTI